MDPKEEEKLLRWWRKRKKSYFDGGMSWNLKVINFEVWKEKLLRWWHELESEEESSRNGNEVQEDEFGESGELKSQNYQIENLHPESDEDGSFLSSGSEYEPSSETESVSETQTETADYNSVEAHTINSWNDVDGSFLKQFTITATGKINVACNLRPVDIFRLIVDMDILNSITSETNKNARRYNSNWTDVCVQELEKFFAIMLYMGLAKLPKISDYWSRKFLYRHCLRPVDIFRLIVDMDILNSITSETNKNARRYNSNWTDVCVQELEKFFAIMLYMGLAKLPKISDYWSHSRPYYCFVRHIMSRNRFQAILRFIHFADNETADKGDRLYKIKPLTDAQTNKFKQLKVPSEVVSIDESMVPFRGRLLFRQYIPGKASKYGVKIFKLCDESGYTYETEIYKGRSDTKSAKWLHLRDRNL
ncbi:Transposase IS4 [Popillia japonica]|uniref:Transposase IS4 n=1 Tax=Popillia japonica TaxID=7064 RepID=A0AAW1KNG9_POPJA